MEKKERKKRMNLEIPEELHCELKARAAIRNMTMTDYIVGILSEKTVQEKFYD